MLNLERALNQDRLLRALTGLNRKAFDALLPSFKQAYAESRIAAKPQRQRAIAGDKHSVGKTAGQALDALTAQLNEIEFSALLVI